MIAESVTDRSLEMDAVDLARIQPAWLDGWRGAHPLVHLRFHGGTSLEALPFAQAQFDLVTSQFGLEYGDFAPTLSELARVLRRGGRLAATRACASSVVYRCILARKASSSGWVRCWSQWRSRPTRPETRKTS